MTVKAILMICCLFFGQSIGQLQNGDNNSVSGIIGQLRDLLIKHSNPKLPIANRAPLVRARFEPVKFDGCDLKWRLVVPLDKTRRISEVIETQLNLGDIDSSTMLVLTDWGDPNHWYVQFSTKTQKMKVQRILLTGTRVTKRESPPATLEAAFHVDSQASGEQISEVLKLAVDQCRAKQ
jgi:hypothetical protein